MMCKQACYDLDGTNTRIYLDLETDNVFYEHARNTCVSLKYGKKSTLVPVECHDKAKILG